jgi:hypothetical protein
MSRFVVIAHKRNGEPVVEHFDDLVKAISFRDTQASDPNTSSASVRYLHNARR